MDFVKNYFSRLNFYLEIQCQFIESINQFPFPLILMEQIMIFISVVFIFVQFTSFILWKVFFFHKRIGVQ